MKVDTLSGVMAVVVVMASFPAAAEWVKVAQTSAATFYVDDASIVKTGTQVKIWQLTDLNKTGSMPAAPTDHLSSISQSHYDCAQRQFRTGYSVDYTGPMGSGPPVRSVLGSHTLAPVPPDSVEAQISAFVCSKP
jgi:hypothetical protein